MRPPPLLLLLALACSSPEPEPARQAQVTPADVPPGSDRFSDRTTPTGSSRFEFQGGSDPGHEVEAGPDPGPGAGTTPVQGRGRSFPVAKLEVIVPPGGDFVLHGTLPLPPGIWPRSDDRTPLALSVGAGQALIPAQLVTVTRSAVGEAEVVELSARVTPPERLRPGQRWTVEVHAGSYPLGDPSPQVPDASARLADPHGEAPILLRTRDVHGNTYTVDLRGADDAPGFGARELLQDGPAQRVLRTYSTLMPVELSGEGKPRPHLMGVHAYWTLRAGEERVGLDLRVHNGATSGSRPAAAEELPVGIVHWDALELVLPIEWRARPLASDPFLGEGYVEGEHFVVPLVRAYEDGTLHMMPPQAQLQRRLTLSPALGGSRAPLSVDGLAFARPGAGLWSWSNPETAHYFPQAALLPDWSPLRIGPLKGERALRTRLLARRDAVRRTLQSGEPQDGLIAGKVLGWAHPLGVPIQGMTGGSGIAFMEGHQAAGASSAAGVETLMLEQRMNASRQPQAQWDRRGQPVGHDTWLSGDGIVPFDFRTNGRMVPPQFRLPMHGGPPPDPQLRAVHLARRRPPYDQGSPHHAEGKLTQNAGDIFAWMPHDGQHYARWTHPSMALVWLTGDALARDDVRMAADTFHLMFHGSEHEHVRWSPGVTLLQFEGLAEAHPHHGLPLGRDQAWGIDAMCAAWSLADDGWRSRRRGWFTRVARLLIDGAMPSGLIERVHIPKILEGRYGAAQAFECLFLLHAQRCLIEAVLAGTDDELAGELAQVHQRALDYLFWGPVWGCVESRNVTLCGPRWHFATGPAGDWSLPPYSDEATYGARFLPPDGRDGGVDVTYVWAPLEYGMLLARGTQGPSLDDRYLRRSLSCGDPARRWDALIQKLFVGAQRDGTDLSGNWGSLVGRLQSLR